MKSKFNKKRGNTLLFVLAIFQVLLLTNLIPANSYLFGFLAISQIQSVNAQEELAMYCCPLTNDNALRANATCQDTLSTETNTCAVNVIQTSCDATSICKTGCCITEQGTCRPKTARSTCEEGEGTWKPGKLCEISQCQQGCCILKDGPEWKNAQECKFLSNSEGIEMDFRNSITTESACLALRQTSEEGACLFEGRCIIKTGRDCVNLNGDFSQGNFCSNPGLEELYNYDYLEKDHKGCAKGKEDVYWFDSNGNREGIVGGIEGIGDCEKGKEACSLNSAGTDYECKDLGCTDETFFRRYRRQPNHGESWCIYDGFIGQGKDTVGSEHWYAECLEGKVNQGDPYKRGPSQSGRGFVCAESKSEYEGTNEFFVTADLVLNEAGKCIEYNSLYQEETLKNKCEKNKHCDFRSIDVTQYSDDDNFKYQVCTPKFPKGSSLRDGIDDSFCGFATLKGVGESACPVIYKKKNRFASWHAVVNKGCEQPVFAQQMGEFCASLGDCGSYINYIGEGTNNAYYVGQKGYELDGDGNEKKDEASVRQGCANDKSDSDCKNPDWKSYLNYSNVRPEQVVLTQDLDYLTASIFGERINTFEPTGQNWDKLNGWIGKISGGSAGLILLLGGKNAIINAFKEGGRLKLLGKSLGGIGTATIGITLGAVVGHYLAVAFGVSGPAATVASIGGGAAGGVGIFGAGPFPGSIGTLGTVVFWVGIAALIGSIILGGPSYETRYVEFYCKPWAPPLGGNNCEKCNEDPMKPCNKYRCESLGALCHLPGGLNNNQENPPCISMEYENNPPIISEGEVLTQNYEFKNPSTSGVKIRRTISVENSDCVEQGNIIDFTLETNEFAQCKWSLTRPGPTYEDMEGNLFEEGNDWAKNHTLKYLTPRVDSLNQIDVTGIVPNRIGNVKIYVKCQDGQTPPNPTFNDYVVDICINEKDTDPVDHSFTKFAPKNQAKLPVGTNQTKLKMWIKESADCKYDTKSGTDYDLMTKEFSCRNGINDIGFFGYLCDTTLKNLTIGENNFYIRCKDQPFENESKRNVNRDDFPFTVYVTEKDLEIKPVSFKYDNGKTVKTISSGETFKEGFQPITVEMEAITSKGADKGKSTCFWGTEQGEKADLMEPYYEASEKHTKILTPRFEGTYNNYIECNDSAGNIAKASAVFNVEVDDTPPVVVRAFHKDGKLKIITNEIAECYYNKLNMCNPFNFENATSMTTALSTEHTAEWDPTKTYYIKCKDAWENINDDCAIVVKPST